jgi:hypothetical protein
MILYKKLFLLFFIFLLNIQTCWGMEDEKDVLQKNDRNSSAKKKREIIRYKDVDRNDEDVDRIYEDILYRIIKKNLEKEMQIKDMCHYMYSMKSVPYGASCGSIVPQFLKPRRGSGGSGGGAGIWDNNNFTICGCTIL